jgi:hypothetical protein
MSAFSDALMVKCLDANAIDELLVPQSDTARDRVRSLLGSVYELPYLDIESVEGVDVLGREFQVPLPEPQQIQGTLERIGPSPERAVASFTAMPRTQSWAAMELDTRVTVKLSVNTGALESILAVDLSDVSSLADFESRFDYIDMPRFMASAGVATLDQLKARFPHQFELSYAEPPVFDPSDPDVERTFRLAVSVLFMADVQLTEALQEAKACRRAAEAARPHAAEADGASVLAASAWMVVFPATASLPTGLTQADVEALFAAEGMVAAFEDTS